MILLDEEPSDAGRGKRAAAIKRLQDKLILLAEQTKKLERRRRPAATTISQIDARISRVATRRMQVIAEIARLENEQ